MFSSIESELIGYFVMHRSKFASSCEQLYLWEIRKASKICFKGEKMCVFLGVSEQRVVSECSMNDIML